MPEAVIEEFPRYWNANKHVYVLGGSKTKKELATFAMKAGDTLCLQDKGENLPFLKKKNAQEVVIIDLPGRLCPNKNLKFPETLSELIELLDSIVSTYP